MKKKQVYKLIEDYYRENFDSLVIRTINKAGGKANAEDIVQEAFTRALTYYTSYVPDIYEFGAWFSRILDNTSKDFHRVEKNKGMVIDVDEDLLEGLNTDPYLRKMLAEIS